MLAGPWSDPRLEQIAWTMAHGGDEVPPRTATQEEIHIIKMYFKLSKRQFEVKDEECSVEEFVVMILNKNVSEALEAIVERRKMKEAWPPQLPESASGLAKSLWKEAVVQLDNKPHVDVYPVIPDGVLVFPVGGYATCQCSATCTRKVMMPAYQVWDDRIPQEPVVREQREPPVSAVRLTAKQRRMMNKLTRP